MNKLNERVREARHKAGLTQEALAGELGVSRSAVAQWEMERGTAPSVENLIALARRSGMAFEYLATGRGGPDCGPPLLAVAEETPVYRHLNSEQRQLLALFSKLTFRQRCGLLDLLSSNEPSSNLHRGRR